jgi:SAM-dependent methyltransferase
MTDDQRADAFSERIFGTVVNAWDLLSISMGTKLGYYEALREQPATSVELADRTGTVERYTREWLEQQAGSGILACQDPGATPVERRYTLPPEHAEVLLDDDSLRFLGGAVQMQMAAILSMPGLLETYRGKKVMSWDDFGDDMRDGQGAMNRPFSMSSLGKGALAAVPELAERLEAGARVADIGCGLGWSSIGLALAYPDVIVDGYDLDEPSIEAAVRFAKEHGVDDRVRFHAIDAGSETLVGEYDLVLAVECVHDMSHPVPVLATMRRIAKVGGWVVVVDERVAERFDPPVDDLERFFYGWSISTCLPDGMSAEGSVGTGTVMRPGTLRGYALDAGFSDVEVLPIENDFFRFYRLVGT